MKDLLSNVIAVIAAIALLVVVLLQNSYIDKLMESNKLLQREVANLLLFFDGATIEEAPNNYAVLSSVEDKSAEFTADGFVQGSSMNRAEDWTEAWCKNWNKTEEGAE